MNYRALVEYPALTWINLGQKRRNIPNIIPIQVFEPFGTVEPHDETGHCKVFGFVQVPFCTDQNAALETSGNIGDFDDDEGGGLALNAQSQALLMQKLDRSGIPSSFYQKNVSGHFAWKHYLAMLAYLRTITERGTLVESGMSKVKPLSAKAESCWLIIDRKKVEV